VRPDPSVPLPEGVTDLEVPHSITISRPPPVLTSSLKQTEADIKQAIKGRVSIVIDMCGCFVMLIHLKGAVQYPLTSDKVLSIPAFVRYKCAEHIFAGNDEDESIPNLILDSLLKVRET